MDLDTSNFAGVITGIVFIPIVAALIILMLRKDQKQEARVIAAAATLGSLLLGLFAESIAAEKTRVVIFSPTERRRVDTEVGEDLCVESVLTD